MGERSRREPRRHGDLTRDADGGWVLPAGIDPNPGCTGRLAPLDFEVRRRGRRQPKLAKLVRAYRCRACGALFLCAGRSGRLLSFAPPSSDQAGSN